MVSKMYKPRAKQRSEEQLAISELRNFILNRAATERIRGNNYVHIYYTTRGRVGIEPVAEREEGSVKLHFAPSGNLASIAASGLLEEMQYRKKLPEQRFDLLWNKKGQRFEFTIPKKFLHGRRRSRSTA